MMGRPPVVWVLGGESKGSDDFSKDVTSRLWPVG